MEGNQTIKLRFHDYGEIYSRPGLYEQLFYDRLKCNSPWKVASILQDTLDSVREHMSELRVLDLGQGSRHRSIGGSRHHSRGQ